MIKHFLSRIHYGIFYTLSLSKLQRKEYSLLIIRENQFRSLLFLLLTILLQIIIFCLLPILPIKTTPTGIRLVTAAVTLELLYIVLILLYHPKSNSSIAISKWMNKSFWIIVCIFMQFVFIWELSIYKTIYLFILFVFCYSVVPLLTLSEILIITGINGVLTCFTSYYYTHNVPLILLIVLFSILSFCVSQRSVSLFYKMTKTNNELILLSETDSLTKLLNRRGIRNKIDILWNDCIAFQKNVAIIMIDIDDFKLYNDTYGHSKGDECLELISQNIHWNVNPHIGIVGRYGGEELLVVLENIKNEDVIPLAQKIRKCVLKLSLESGIGATHDFVTISLGIHTLTPTEASKFSDAIKLSDQQLYLAKKGGRNCIAYHNFIYK